MAQIYNLCNVHDHCMPTERETQNIDVSTALVRICNLCRVHNRCVPTECETQNIDVSTLCLLRKYTSTHCVGADLKSVPCIPLCRRQIIRHS